MLLLLLPAFDNNLIGSQASMLANHTRAWCNVTLHRSDIRQPFKWQPHFIEKNIACDAVKVISCHSPMERCNFRMYIRGLPAALLQPELGSVKKSIRVEQSQIETISHEYI